MQSIQSTAGAIPLLNEKGEVYMQKVKVNRYISGKRPEYAQNTSSEEDSSEEFLFDKTKKQNQDVIKIAKIEQDERDDPRLKWLHKNKHEPVIEERPERHRHIHAPEVLVQGDESELQKLEDEISEKEDSDDEIEKRRSLLRKRQLESREEETDILAVEDEAKPEPKTEESASEYEEFSESEEEVGPIKLAPIFVRKRDRITIEERDRIELQQEALEDESKKMAEERRKETLRIIESENRREIKHGLVDPSEAILTDDDENDEAEYESWKLRELQRIKRDRDERRLHEEKKLELERYREMNDDERRKEDELNPKMITNKSVKGKYKFMQKYYHRGAFYMDQEEELFKRDYSQPTMEDCVRKEELPKIKQVKNFGRSGRSKYTHLVDQDTTRRDSPWAQQNKKDLLIHSKSGGIKETFDRPSFKKRKTTY